MQYCGSCSYSDNVDPIGNSGNGDNRCFDIPEKLSTIVNIGGAVFKIVAEKRWKEQEYDRRGIIEPACGRDSMEPSANNSDGSPISDAFHYSHVFVNMREYIKDMNHGDVSQIMVNSMIPLFDNAYLSLTASMIMNHQEQAS